MFLILSLALGAAPPDSRAAPEAPVLRLHAAKPRILVGEAQKLMLLWHTQRPLEIHPESAQVMLDAGGGYRPYRETAIATCGGGWRVGELIVKPGEPYRSSYVMAVEGQLHTNGENDFRFAFPRPGAYRVRVEYQTLVSNEVQILVAEPQGRDADLFRDVLRRRPELLTAWSFDASLAMEFDLDEVGRVLREYEGSPYLYRIRQLYWWRRLQESHHKHRLGETPTEDQRVWLRQVEGDATSDDPFYAERLMAAAQTLVAWGDTEGATRTYKKLLSEQPDSEIAAQAQSWLATYPK